MVISSTAKKVELPLQFLSLTMSELIWDTELLFFCFLFFFFPNLQNEDLTQWDTCWISELPAGCFESYTGSPQWSDRSWIERKRCVFWRYPIPGGMYQRRLLVKHLVTCLGITDSWFIGWSRNHKIIFTGMGQMNFWVKCQGKENECAPEMSLGMYLSFFLSLNVCTSEHNMHCLACLLKIPFIVFHPHLLLLLTKSIFTLRGATFFSPPFSAPFQGLVLQYWKDQGIRHTKNVPSKGKSLLCLANGHLESCSIS